MTKIANRKLSAKLGLVVLGAFMLFTTAAGAIVAIQNFMQLNIESADACLIKKQGKDSDAFGDPALDPYVGFDDSTSVVTPTGIEMIQENLTIRGQAGDRMLVTDAARIINDCDYDLDVYLIAEPDVAGNPAVDGDWSDKEVSVYIATDFDGNSVLDFSDPADWDQSPLNVDATGTITNNQTGTVTIPAGDNIQIGAVIDIDRNDAASTGILRWTVTAIPQP